MSALKRKSLAELSAEEVVKACEQNYIDYWRCVGSSPNAEFSENRGITQCITGLSQDIFNVVLKCNLAPETIDSRIDDAIRYYKSRRIPMVWHAGMLSEPKDIGRYLEARGFLHDYDLAAMAIELDSLHPSPDLPEAPSVKTVASGLDSKHWVECLTSSWESPKEAVPWMLQNACFNVSLELEAQRSLPRRMYLGLLEGQPVSTSMLVWSNDVAGLQAIGTVRSARGKGAGTAVITAALADARMMGFKFAVVLSTVEGLGLYKKCGFRAFGKLPEHSMHFEELRP
ncbi:MAG: GNAT family N-acetyltransferase [Thermoplasmata archaeon]